MRQIIDQACFIIGQRHGQQNGPVNGMFYQPGFPGHILPLPERQNGGMFGKQGVKIPIFKVMQRGILRLSR